MNPITIFFIIANAIVIISCSYALIKKFKTEIISHIDKVATGKTPSQAILEEKMKEKK